MKLPGPLASRYRFLQVLGTGSAGQVVLAEDLELARPVAIKFLIGSGEVANRARFLEEAKLLAGLRHPHILQLFDFGADGPDAWLVVELATGGNLEALAAGTGLAPARAVSHAALVLDALAYVHGQGILHRDVKPANVLLSRDGSPRLADFGLAKSARSGVRTVTGVILGTPQYMAPELLLGGAASPASDLYAWGATLHFLLHGKPAVDGNVAEILRRARAGGLVPASASGPAAQAMRRALEPDPARRAGVAELARLLAPGDPDPTTLRPRSRSREPGGTAATLAVSDVRVPEARTLAAPQAPARSPGPRLVAAGLGLAGLMALALRIAGQAGTPPAAAPAAIQAGSEALDLLRTWRALLKPSPPRGQARARNDRVLSDLVPDFRIHYQEAMAAARQGRGPPDRLVRLEAERGLLPFRVELDRDRPKLEALLGDPGVPFPQRRDLFELLQQLAEVDAYFEGFGRDPPYAARALLARFVPIRVEKKLPPAVNDATIEEVYRMARPRITEPLLDPSRPAPPGTHLVYHWVFDQRRKLGLLLQHPDDLSPVQSGAIDTAMGLGITSAEPVEAYGGVDLAVDLGEAPAAHFSRVSLLLAVGNLALPDALRVSWNGLLVDVRMPPGPDLRTTYYPLKGPEAILEVELPLEAVQAGRNELGIRLTELPGLVHYQGCDLDSVHLRLVAR